jgi:uncharacterized protein YukE
MIGRHVVGSLSELSSEYPHAAKEAQRSPVFGNRKMTQAIVDPAELRRFAQMLKRFNEELNEKTGAVAGRLNELSQTWRDHEQQRFSEEFVANMKALGHFVECNEQFIPYLLRKAQLIEEYLQQQ